MSWTAGARWLIALATRRPAQRWHADPADMGTAFGLDATTQIDDEPTAQAARRAPPPPRTSRFEERLHRRSTL